MSSYVFYNQRSANGRGAARAKEVAKYLTEEPEYLPVSNHADYVEFFAKLKPEDEVVLSGGDGTLNRFINDCEGIALPEHLKYYPAGTGNDFRNDLGLPTDSEPFDVMPYMQHLPVITVKGTCHKFFNGIGYGLDGWTCEMADKQRQTNDKPINYTLIALKGLLYAYKPTNAVVTVDGKRMAFTKVWLAPTMKGRFFGGGMMITPSQDRNAPDHSVSVAVIHDVGRLKLLTVFPGIFEGKHVKHTECFKVFAGHEIKVEFDRPIALQIDGDVILDVKEYTVTAPKA